MDFPQKIGAGSTFPPRNLNFCGSEGSDDELLQVLRQVSRIGRNRDDDLDVGGDLVDCVQNLDSIFKTLNKEFKTTGEESLLGTKTTEQNELSNKIEIVKHIVSVKLADKAKAQTARENAERRQQLLEVLAKKQNQALYDMSEAEIQAQLAALDAE